MTHIRHPLLTSEMYRHSYVVLSINNTINFTKRITIYFDSKLVSTVMLINTELTGSKCTKNNMKSIIHQ